MVRDSCTVLDQPQSCVRMGSSPLPQQASTYWTRAGMWLGPQPHPMIAPSSHSSSGEGVHPTCKKNPCPCQVGWDCELWSRGSSVEVSDKAQARVTPAPQLPVALTFPVSSSEHQCWQNFPQLWPSFHASLSEPGSGGQRCPSGNSPSSAGWYPSVSGADQTA